MRTHFSQSQNERFAQRISIAARISSVQRYSRKGKCGAHRFKYKMRIAAFFALTAPRSRIIHPPLRVRISRAKNEKKR